MKSLETHLRAQRDAGVKCLVPYFMAGATPDWLQHVEAAVAAGASAVEVGIPFSDPIIDGAVVQEAGLRALRAGTTLDGVCSDLAGLSVGAPLVAMTYYNIFHHYGERASARRLVDGGFSGAIVPDLSLEEAEPWREACHPVDLATVFLVAPSTPPERVTRVAAMSQGFVYASARMAVTGMAEDIGEAPSVVSRVRAVSDIPVLVGIGISTPAHAQSAAESSDGVIVGSAIVQRILDGASPAQTEAFIGEFRRALS